MEDIDLNFDGYVGVKIVHEKWETKRAYCAKLFSYYTGKPIEEVLSLTWAGLDQIHLPNEAIEILELARAHRVFGSQYVFSNQDGEKITNWGEVYERVLREAGIPDWSNQKKPEGRYLN